MITLFTFDVSPLAFLAVLSTNAMLVLVSYWAYRRARTASHTERLRIEHEAQQRAHEVLVPKSSPVEQP